MFVSLASNAGNLLSIYQWLRQIPQSAAGCGMSMRKPSEDARLEALRGLNHLYIIFERGLDPQCRLTFLIA